MNRDINRAQAKDRREEKKSNISGTHLRALLEGEDGGSEYRNSEVRPVLREWLPWLRNVFQKHIIRRTLDSVDYKKDKIFGLPPYYQHLMLLELRDWEKEYLSIQTKELIDTAPVATVAGTSKVCI